MLFVLPPLGSETGGGRPISETGGGRPISETGGGRPISETGGGRPISDFISHFKRVLRFHFLP